MFTQKYLYSADFDQIDTQEQCTQGLLNILENLHSFNTTVFLRL